MQAALEACTGSADLADELVEQAGWVVHQAHPGYVHRLKQSPDKTDYGDARLLADLLRVGYLPLSWRALRWIRELRTVVRHRQHLVDRRRSVKLRIGAILREQRVERGPGSRWAGPWRGWLREQVTRTEQGRWVVDASLEELAYLNQAIDRTEDRLRGMTEGDPVVQRLMAYRGVGLIV